MFTNRHLIGIISAFTVLTITICSSIFNIQDFSFNGRRHLNTVRSNIFATARTHNSSDVSPAGTGSPIGLNGVVLVETDGNFLERVRQFNVFLDTLRAAKYTAHLKRPWRRPGPKTQVISSAEGDYLRDLANFSHVTTLALPWLKTPSASNWNSPQDQSNVLLQNYYAWTADDPLCTWLETPGTIKWYDEAFNRTCERDMEKSSKPISLAPTFLNGKPINPAHYRPDDGNFYPKHYYTYPPKYVFSMHIHRDALITKNGEVYSRNLKLVLRACKSNTKPALPLGGNLDSVPLHKEVFIIAQFWGTEVFHMMVEIVPRVTAYVDFLKKNPQIRILAPEAKGGRLGEIFTIFGLDPTRLITGFVRAKIAYQPRATNCGIANVQESQIASRLYDEYIGHSLGRQPRDRLVLIRRSGTRRFSEQTKIEKVVEKAAGDFSLKYTMFADNPTPSFNETMKLFKSAVAVVAPHGAGIGNVYFSDPGTFVVEGVCNLPHANLCFQRLVHILGQRWHGIPSRGGCKAVVDVPATNVDRALRKYLQIWTSEIKQ